MALGDLKGNDSVFLLIIAALFGAVVKTGVDRGAGSAEGASQAGDTTAERPPAREAAANHRKRGLMDAAFESPEPELPSDRTDVCQVLKDELGNPACERHAGLQPGVIIALVPDPATSGFVEAFDDGLDAIQQAARSQHYALYRHWLPWQRDNMDMAQRNDVAKPGWLLFRGDVSSRKGESLESTSHVLLVLLVGERLGSGVNRTMLTHALDLSARLNGPDRPRILGPYFSGTSVSLRAGLEAWCGSSAATGCASSTAEIVAGTAVRWTNAEFLSQTSRLHVDFQTTVNPEMSLMRGMQKFLKDALGVDRSHIAELREIGSGAWSPITDETKCPRSREPNSLRISYPAHLPDLRVPAVGADLPAPAFRDDEYSVDVVPMFTLRTLTEAKQILAGTIEALRRNLMTDAGILATANGDKISLISALRSAAPDIRPHLYGASLVLAEPALQPATDGTLVASSYPLSTAPQIWSGQAGAQQFGSDAAEGIYNALLLLLSDARGLARDKKVDDMLLDYGEPFQGPSGQVPRVWISVIVGGQIWPLAAYQVPVCRDPEFVRRAVRRDDLTIHSGRLAALGLSLLLFLNAANLLSLVRAFRPLRRWPFLLLHDPAWVTSEGTGFLCLERFTARGSRGPLLVGIWVSTILGCVGAVLHETPFLVHQHPPVGWGDRIAVLLLIVSVLLFLAPMGAVPTLGRLKPGAGTRQLLARLWLWVRWCALPAAMMVSLIALGFRFCRFYDLNPVDGRALLLFARMVHPELGMAPALPLLLLAIAIYASCLFRLRVVRSGAALRAGAPRWVRSGVPGLPEAFDDFANESVRPLGYVLWSGVGIGLAMFGLLRARSLEGKSFDVAVAFGFGLTYSLAATSLLRLYHLGERLKRVLQSLAAHPWAPAFSKLPDHVSQTFRTPMPGRLPRKAIVPYCRVAGALADANPLPGQPAGPPAGDRIEAYLHELQPIWNRAGVRPPSLENKVAAGRPLPVQLREHYLALSMAKSLSQMCDIARSTLSVSATTAVAAVLAMMVYPFQPRGTLTWLAPITIALVVVASLKVIAGISRNELLSRIAGTRAGRVTLSWALVARLIGYVGVPLASLAASYRPNHDLLSGILRNLNSSIQP
jgi:hypothetical protein